MTCRILTNAVCVYFPMVDNETGLLNIYNSYYLNIWPGHPQVWNSGLAFHIQKDHYVKFISAEPGVQITLCFRRVEGGFDFIKDNVMGPGENRVVGLLLHCEGSMNVFPDKTLAKVEFYRKGLLEDELVHAKIDLYKHFISL